MRMFVCVLESERERAEQSCRVCGSALSQCILRVPTFKWRFCFCTDKFMCVCVRSVACVCSIWACIREEETKRGRMDGAKKYVCTCVRPQRPKGVLPEY